MTPGWIRPAGSSVQDDSGERRNRGCLSTGGLQHPLPGQQVHRRRGLLITAGDHHIDSRDELRDFDLDTIGYAQPVQPAQVEVTAMHGGDTDDCGTKPMHADYYKRMSEVSQPRRPYRPQLPAEDWAAISPYVHDLVRRAAPLVTYDSRELYPAVTRLVDFARREYAPLEDDVVLDPSMIGRFVNHHLAGYNRASRNTIRARLRRVAEALLGDDAAARFTALGKADASRPYSDAEQAALEGWSRAQHSPERRTSAAALLSLGFGAGLTGAEIIRQRLEDIRLTADIVEVRVGGENERVVPLRDDWADGLRGRYEHRDGSGWAFRVDQRGENINLITDFVSRTGTGIPLQSRRMRATWLIRHLEEATPLKTLLRIAGLHSAEALDRLLPYVQD